VAALVALFVCLSEHHPEQATTTTPAAIDIRVSDTL